jgi:hypothetical protein
MSSNIVRVITEAVNRQNAELNAQLYTALITLPIEELGNADVFARLGIRVEQTGHNVVTIQGSNTIRLIYDTTHQEVVLPNLRGNGRKVHFDRAEMKKIDFIDLLTNQNHPIRRKTKINPSVYFNTQYDEDDLLNIQAKERNDYYWLADPDLRSYDVDRVRNLKWKAEQRSGLTFNPRGKQRVIRKK